MISSYQQPPLVSPEEQPAPFRGPDRDPKSSPKPETLQPSIQVHSLPTRAKYPVPQRPARGPLSSITEGAEGVGSFFHGFFGLLGLRVFTFKLLISLCSCSCFHLKLGGGLAYRCVGFRGFRIYYGSQSSCDEVMGWSEWPLDFSECSSWPLGCLLNSRCPGAL